MDNDIFQKKTFELKSAVTVFKNSYPGDTSDVYSKVDDMNGHITVLDSLWQSYQSVKTNDESKKIHVKLKTKIAMLFNCLAEARKACTGARLQKKYGEGLDYIGKKITELNAEFPRKPKEFEESSETVDLFNVDMKDEPPKIVKKEEPPPIHEFQRKIAEMRACVTSFVQSYDEKERRRSVVAYIGDLEMYLKCIERFWKRYNAPVRNEGTINSMYSSIRIELDTMQRYYEMSVMIAKANNVDARYATNHEYVKKKLDELLSAFPEKPRGLRDSDSKLNVIIVN